MSYPQPNANKYALDKQQFFRLNTPLQTDGDIYQSEQGGCALAIGPDSDISKVIVGYYDGQVSRYMNQVAITPERPFIGTIPARNDAAYAPSGVPGRTLFWPDEIYNPAWRPTNWGIANVRVDFITPVMDVIQYFTPTQINNNQRNNKIYHYDRLPLNGAEFYWLVVPFYGRRYASVKLFNNSGGNFSGWSVWGLNYRPGTDLTAPEDSGVLTAIVADAAVNDGDTANSVIKASASGMYDALAMRLTPGFAVTVATNLMLDIVVSDREA